MRATPPRVTHWTSEQEPSRFTTSRPGSGTGERAEPTFLITKPFKPEMVKAVISQALFFDVRAGGRPRGEAA